MVEDPLEIALLVAAAIERADGSYFVGGSVASSLQGDPRATNDIDFVVELTRVRAFAEALGPDFEVDQAMVHDALTTSGSANIFYLPWVTKMHGLTKHGLGRDRFAVGRGSPLAHRIAHVGHARRCDGLHELDTELTADGFE